MGKRQALVSCGPAPVLGALDARAGTEAEAGGLTTLLGAAEDVALPAAEADALADGATVPERDGSGPKPRSAKEPSNSGRYTMIAATPPTATMSTTKR